MLATLVSPLLSALSDDVMSKFLFLEITQSNEYNHPQKMLALILVKISQNNKIICLEFKCHYVAQKDHIRSCIDIIIIKIVNIK